MLLFYHMYIACINMCILCNGNIPCTVRLRLIEGQRLSLRVYSKMMENYGIPKWINLGSTWEILGI